MKPTEISILYEKYLGPKCSKTTYYKNLKKGMSLLEALKPIPKEKRYEGGKVYSKKFANELKWYMEQKGEKVPKTRFYQRLYQGWDKEEAIKLVVPIHWKKISVNKPKIPYVRQAIPQKKEVNKDYEDIRIRYNKSEAMVFIREYESMIEELENRYQEIDDVNEAREISNKLEKLIKEYQVFKLNNMESKSP